MPYGIEPAGWAYMLPTTYRYPTLRIPTLVFTTRGGYGVVVGDEAGDVDSAGACFYPVGMHGAETGKYQKSS